jgi:hypothetical protein
MMTPNPGLTDLVHDLKATLEAISEGLADGVSDRLLDAEPRLAELTARLTAARTDASTAPSRDDIAAAQAALRRCQELGATIRSLGEIYASAQAGGYDRSGRLDSSDAAGVLHARG